MRDGEPDPVRPDEQLLRRADRRRAREARAAGGRAGSSPSADRAVERDRVVDPHARAQRLGVVVGHLVHRDVCPHLQHAGRRRRGARARDARRTARRAPTRRPRRPRPSGDGAAPDRRARRRRRRQAPTQRCEGLARGPRRRGYRPLAARTSCRATDRGPRRHGSGRLPAVNDVDSERSRGQGAPARPLAVRRSPRSSACTCVARSSTRLLAHQSPIPLLLPDEGIYGSARAVGRRGRRARDPRRPGRPALAALRLPDRAGVEDGRRAATPSPTRRRSARSLALADRRSPSG